MIRRFLSRLTKEEVKEKVDGSLGVYVLYSRKKDARYVGMSTDLRDLLLDKVGSYKFFWFEHYDSEEKAYWVTSRLYHQLGEKKELANEKHPSRPSGSGLECPDCDIHG